MARKNRKKKQRLRTKDLSAKKAAQVKGGGELPLESPTFSYAKIRW